MRTPISKQRNKHIQQVLVEAARLAPRYSEELALFYERERQRGKQQSRDAGGREEAGDLHAGRGETPDRFRSCRGVTTNRGSMKTPSEEGKNIRISEAQTARSRK